MKRIAKKCCCLSRTRRFQGFWHLRGLDPRNTTSYGLLFHIVAFWRYAASSYTARIPVLYAPCLPYFLDLFVSHVLLLTCLYLRLRTRGSTCLLDPANPQCSKLNYSLGYLSRPSPALSCLLHQFTDASSSVSSLHNSSVSHAARLACLSQAPRPLSRRTRLLSPSFHDFRLVPRPSYTDVQRDKADYSGFICYFHLFDRRRQKIIGKSLDTRHCPKDQQARLTTRKNSLCPGV